jgi:hypothetical protein
VPVGQASCLSDGLEARPTKTYRDAGATLGWQSGVTVSFPAITARILSASIREPFGFQNDQRVVFCEGPKVLGWAIL